MLATPLALVSLCPGQQISCSVTVAIQSGTTHLAKSLASCKDTTSLKLYFTTNAAFNHFMAAYALPHSRLDPNQLLPEQYIFDIFLNDSAPKCFLCHRLTDIILPLDPPDTLHQLFISFPYCLVSIYQKLAFFSYCEAYQD